MTALFLSFQAKYFFFLSSALLLKKETKMFPDGRSEVQEGIKAKDISKLSTEI